MEMWPVMNAWTQIVYPEVVRNSGSVIPINEANTRSRQLNSQPIQIAQAQPLSMLKKVSSEVDSPDKVMEWNFDDEDIEESGCNDRLNKEHYQLLIQHIRRIKPLPTLYISQRILEHENESCVSSISQFQSFNMSNNQQSMLLKSINLNSINQQSSNCESNFKSALGSIERSPYSGAESNRVSDNMSLSAQSQQSNSNHDCELSSSSSSDEEEDDDDQSWATCRLD